MSSSQIVVNPAQLRKYADDIGKCYTSYRSNLVNATGQINSLKGVWTGDAADAFTHSFSGMMQKCMDALETINRMVSALYESADAFEKNEKAIQNEASKIPKLPSNTMR
jgi:WXG100 family type VII secretion target